jgi:hypothetical protein
MSGNCSTNGKDENALKEVRVKKLEGKRKVGRYRCTVEIYFREMVHEHVDFIELPHDRVQWRSFVST